MLPYKYFLLSITFLSFSIYSASTDREPSTPILRQLSSHDTINTGTKLHRRKEKAPVYLECLAAGDLGSVLDRTFSIRLHPEFNPDFSDTSTHHKEIGYLNIQIKAGTCVITHISVESSHRKKGYGPIALQTLINAYAVEHRKKVPFTFFKLDVEKKNTRAQKAFRKAGFEINSTGPLYENYHTMERPR